MELTTTTRLGVASSTRAGGARFQSLSPPQPQQADTVTGRFEQYAQQYDRPMTADEIEAAITRAVDPQALEGRLAEAGCLPNLESWGLDPQAELEATIALKAPEAQDQLAENLDTKTCLDAIQGDDRHLDQASLSAAEDIGSDQIRDYNREAAKANLRESTSATDAATPATTEGAPASRSDATVTRSEATSAGKSEAAAASKSDSNK